MNNSSEYIVRTATDLHSSEGIQAFVPQWAPGLQVLHAKQRAQTYKTARSSRLVFSYKAVPVVLRDGPSFTSASIAYGFIFLKTCQDGIKTFLYFEFWPILSIYFSKNVKVS